MAFESAFIVLRPFSRYSFPLKVIIQESVEHAMRSRPNWMPVSKAQAIEIKL